MTNEVTCQQTSHLSQRYRIIGEKYGGGLNKYKHHYRVKLPIKMKVSKYKFVDEEKLYTDFRMECPLYESLLIILILEELAYKIQSVSMLQLQAGHKLYGLWIPNPDIPYIWHFKEGPSICLRQGMWNKLIYLYTYAMGKIFLNDTVKA